MEGEGTEDDPYVITDVEELQAMNEDLEAHYVLGNDIDASDTATWNAGAGFEPVGTYPDEGTPFSGSFDGQNRTITDLMIDRPAGEFVGLFGSTTGPVENVHLEDVDVTADRWAAPLAGWAGNDVRHASATGQAEGHRGIGGLVGGVGADDTAVIERAATDVEISAEWHAGGITGSVVDARVIESYAHGDVQSETRFGGGLVGNIDDDGEVRLSYATGDVSSGNDIGGLNGRNLGLVSESYAIGKVTGTSEYHGAFSGRILADDYGARISDSYWNIETAGLTSGAPDGPAGIGLETAEMTGAAAETNMSRFDFEHFWAATDEYPVLEWQVEDVSVSLEESTVSEGDQTGVTVTLTLDDGSTVTASEVADYDDDGLVNVDSGTVDTNEHGTTEITATVAGESGTAELEITEPPNIELEDASLEAAAVVNDSETAVTATATYENDGGPGGQTVELVADGDVVASDRIWVDADDETTVVFEWTPDADAGTEYDVAIDETVLGSLTVVSADAVVLESVSAPVEIGSGAPYKVTVDLETDHDEAVLAPITYELEGDQVGTESIVIDPDGSTATFEHESDAAAGGTLAHAVSLNDARNDEVLEATSDVAEPPAFEITDVEAPGEVDAGDEFDLEVTVENTGGLEGTQQVVVADDGTELGSTDLSLGADSSDTATMTVVADDAGEYDYLVATDDDEATASVTVTEDDDSSGADDSAGDESDSDGLPGFTLGVALVALVAAVALIGRRR